MSRCLTLCLPRTNLQCATLFGSTLEFGRHFEGTIFNLLYIFTCKSYGKEPKSQINNACAQCEPETMVIASLSNTMNNRCGYNCTNRQTWQVYGRADWQTWQTKS